MLTKIKVLSFLSTEVKVAAALSECRPTPAVFPVLPSSPVISCETGWLARGLGRKGKKVVSHALVVLSLGKCSFL